jgi:phosphatidate cytidylyltransferase
VLRREAAMGLLALIVSGATFAVAAIVLIVFSLRIRDRGKIRDAWTIWALQFLTMGVILVPAYVGGILFAAVTAVLASLCLLELLRVQKEAVPLAMKVVVVAFGLATFALAHLRPFPALYLSIPLAAAVLLVANLFFPNEHRHLQSAAQCLLGLVYIPVFLAHVVLIRKQENGFLIIFFMYGLSEIHDSFAYLFGRMLGKKKIFPNISPNKTYVGSISGLVAAVVAGLVVNRWGTRFSLAFAAAAIAIIICFTILGDLVSSKIKRSLGVKDFGSLIPRIGGLLDSYDSLVFIAPFVYYLSLLVAS